MKYTGPSCPKKHPSMHMCVSLQEGMQLECDILLDSASNPPSLLTSNNESTRTGWGHFPSLLRVRAISV